MLSVDKTRVLLVHRNRRADDLHFGKYNGLGGKLEAGEDIVAGIRREIREEADIACDELKLRGTISWPGFGGDGADWFGFVFRIDRWHGTVRRDNAEGTLDWIPIDDMLELPLWEGDRHFLPLVFGKSNQQFHGVMPYENGKPISWACTLVDGSTGTLATCPTVTGVDS